MPGISDLLDSDMEENNFIDEDSIISSVSDATDTAPAAHNKASNKKTKKRHCVTMPKPKSRVVKGSPALTATKPPKKPTASKRKALEDVVDANVVAESQQQEVSEAENGMEVEAAPRATRKPATTVRASKKKTTADQAASEDMEVEQTPMVAHSNFAQDATGRSAPKVTKASRAPTRKKIQEETIPEVQTELLYKTTDMDEPDEIIAQQPPVKRTRTESRTRHESTYRRRAGSASDTERGDPNLRRKLGDVTRKFENIDMKYRNLKEVGLGEASANVEKLRKQCEATTEASNNLIASLKKELAQQAPLLQDVRKLKKELQAREDEMAVLRTSQTEMTASLGAAQNEIKVLQARLAAARTTTASAESLPMKTPGSAMKVARSVAVSNAEAAQAAQAAQMKLDLYGDLTGLLVRSVKRAEDGDTFDCIQTGRNGTLHFRLFIDQEDARTASFEETEFLYTPLLDTSRDHDMIELMPPYLTEDITFARQNAAKFYQRVVDTLTRRTNES